MNRLRWGIAGLAIGLLLAYMRWQTLSSTPPGRAVLPSMEFERLLCGTFVDRPQIDNLMIHPTPTGYRVDATAWEFTNLNFIQADVTTMFPMIFHPTGKIHPIAQDLGFLDYMGWASKKFPWIHYRYFWWEEPLWLFSGYALIAMLISVGLWPLALRLLVGGSAFDERETKEKNYVPPELNPDAGSFGLTAADGDTAALRMALESRSDESQRLRETTPGSTGVAVALKSLPSKQLQADPRDKPTPADSKKQFGGTFYPTELHGPGSETL